MKYEAIINTKSKSAIGWNNIRPIRHFELVKNLKDEYYDETVNFVKNIKENITEQSIDTILNNFDDTIISNQMKKLLKEFIYDNSKLFANFAARLPEPTRPEIKEILATYSMEKYDDFELLKRSGAKLPTNDYEFVR